MDASDIRKVAKSIGGGRLPPIANRNVATILGSKKMVAPKIPQRRIKVEHKNRTSEHHAQNSSLSPSVDREDGWRGRGRGRAAKVYLQTEGTFLGEGPSQKVKKEFRDFEFERISTPKFSRAKNEAELKVEAGLLNSLLESYDENDAYTDYEHLMKPVRIPFSTICVKKETKLEQEVLGVKIKKEPIDFYNDDFSKNVRFDNVNACLTKMENTESETKVFVDEIKKSQDRGILLLLQMPSCLPFDCNEEKNEEKKTQANSKVENSIKKSCQPLRKNAEGLIGKLQILKSGRIQIVLGSVKLDLEGFRKMESVWQAASVSPADITILGQIQHKVTLRPDVESLI